MLLRSAKEHNVNSELYKLYYYHIFLYRPTCNSHIYIFREKTIRADLEV